MLVYLVSKYDMIHVIIMHYDEFIMPKPMLIYKFFQAWLLIDWQKTASRTDTLLENPC